VPHGLARAVKRAACGLLDAAGGLLGLVFPDQCRVCGDSLHELSRIPVCARCLGDPQPFTAEYFCSSCRAPFVNRFPLDETGRCGLCRMGLQGFDAVYTYGSYEGTLRKLLHLFKYDGVRPLARAFGEWLALALPREQSFDAVVPMPLHWRKRWQRGFNQADVLAREVSRRWNVPMRRVVTRRRPTAAQAGLTNSQRRLNVSGAFRAKRGVRLKGLRILLVDDVLTTGATASACARALKRAGAAHVSLLALARTDRRMAVDFQVPNAAAPSAADLTQAAGQEAHFVKVAGSPSV
jgi:ComF family protein